MSYERGQAGKRSALRLAEIVLVSTAGISLFLVHRTSYFAPVRGFTSISQSGHRLDLSGSPSSTIATLPYTVSCSTWWKARAGTGWIQVQQVLLNKIP